MSATAAARKCLFVLLLLPPSGAVTAQAPPYLDPARPLDRRVDDLVGRMTLEEKALMLYHNAPGLERLRVPAWGGWNQAIHGVWSKTPTTLFPVSIALAATWDPALVRRASGAISDEARALYHGGAAGPHGKHGLVYRAPVINISRDPRWGRIQECYGEDPYLTSRIAVAYVKGLQGDDPNYLKVAATLKHFAVNNQEQGRMSLSAQVPERMLMEYWLPHFRACVVEGRAQSLMAAYNAINGTPCAVNKHLLTEILRDQWGFDGFVVSDLGGIGQLMTGHRLTKKPEEAVARALLAGCDFDDEQYRDAIPRAVRDGLVSEEVVNRALSRVLRVAFRLGVFDPPERVPFTKTPMTVIDSPAHRELALKAEREAIVLLQNKDHFLPLDRGKLRKVAVLGPAADRPEYGNYFGAAPKRVSPLEGLRNKLGGGAEVVSAPGCDFVAPADAAAMNRAVEAAKDADVAVLCLGTNGRVEAEGRDRKDLNLPGAQEELLKAVVKANPKTVVVLFNAGPLAVTWAKEHVPAILQACYPGEEGGTAIADVLCGDYNPAGRLPYTVYESVAQIPPQSEYDVTKGFTYLYFEGKPLFPFGHGLSYTQFRYGDLKLSARRIGPDGKVQVSVVVTNVGDRAGDEVAQLYVHQAAARVKRPIKELRGFQRVSLKPGEERTLTFALAGDQLSYYDVAKKAFVVEPGAFEVMVGSSSGDIRARARLDVTAGEK
jgi:beta-glucosidase